MNSQNEKNRQAISPSKLGEEARHRIEVRQPIRMTLEDEKTIRRYLLQELSEEELERVEERMMTDDVFSEEVTFAEDELAAEYARKALKGSELRAFERSFLATAEGRHQVDFNKVFRAHILRTAIWDDPRRSFRSLVRSLWTYQKPAMALALSAMVILISGNAWLVVMEQHRRSEIDRLQAEMQRVEKELADQHNQATQLQRDFQESQQKNSDLERQLADLKNARDRIGQNESIGFLSVVLSPGSIRGPAGQTVTIAPDKHTIEFRLRVPFADYLVDSAELAGKGQESITRDRLEVRRVKSETLVILRLPAAKFAPGPYELKLLGKTQGDAEPIDYSFTVVAK